MNDWRASNFKDGDKFTFDCPCCGEVHEGTVGKRIPIQCDSKRDDMLIGAVTAEVVPANE